MQDSLGQGQEDYHLADRQQCVWEVALKNPILDWPMKVSRVTSLVNPTKRSHTDFGHPCKQPTYMCAAETGGQPGMVHLCNTVDSRNHKTSP